MKGQESENRELILENFKKVQCCRTQPFLPSEISKTQV